MRDVRFVNLPRDRVGLMRIPRGRDFEVQGVGFFEASDDALVASVHVVRDGSLTSLRHAVAKYNENRGTSDTEPVEMFISDDHPDQFDPEESVFLVNRLRISADAVLVSAESPTPAFLPSSEPVNRLLSPFLKARRAELSTVTRIDGARGDAIEVEVNVPTRGRTVGDALRIGEDAQRLLDAAFATGPLRAETAAELLRTGHQDVLVGQPESDWIDGKSVPYVLNDTGRFLLARDIASFANAAGGIIAIGLHTSKLRGQDIIRSAPGVRLAGVNVAQYRSVPRTLIYPRPQRVRVDVVPRQDDPNIGIVVVEIPEQPTSLKPFFVRRAEFAGRIRTEHFTVPIRDNDATSYADVAELHVLIVAGRAALGNERQRAPAQSEPPG